jgi:hypothetical protein
MDNTEQVRIEDSANVWDDGVDKGNCRSAYNGTDSNIDGIGDTLYLIDENNQNNCRLMSLWSASTVEEAPFWTQWWLWAIVVARIIPIAGTVYFLKKSKSSFAPTPSSGGTV